MSFALLDRLRRNVSVRLSLWFTLLFAAGTAAVVLLVYYLVAQELQRKEIEVIQSRAPKAPVAVEPAVEFRQGSRPQRDRKSTRLNSSHG